MNEEDREAISILARAIDRLSLDIRYTFDLNDDDAQKVIALINYNRLLFTNSGFLNRVHIVGWETPGPPFSLTNYRTACGRHFFLSGPTMFINPHQVDNLCKGCLRAHPYILQEPGRVIESRIAT